MAFASVLFVMGGKEGKKKRRGKGNLPFPGRTEKRGGLPPLRQEREEREEKRGR